MVVLANQRDKSAHITEFPFALAYTMFERGLRGSNHWLVVGYSFRDDGVNELLRREFAERETKPNVLVVTYGEQPSRLEVERSLGWNVEDGNSRNWLTINRLGADGIERTEDWREFVSRSVTPTPRSSPSVPMSVLPWTEHPLAPV